MAVEMTFGWSSGLRTDGKVGAQLLRTENTRNTAEIAWPGAETAEIPGTGTIRGDLFTSTTISWSCKSSVMEMTKNRMVKAQLIATIFRQLLAGRLGRAAARDKLLHSNPIPTIATHTQTRFSASSMVSKVSYATRPPRAIAFHPNCRINYALARTKRSASVNRNQMEEVWTKMEAAPRGPR